MSQKLNRVPGGPAFRLVILALAILGLGLVGCSEDLPTQTPVDSTTSTTSVFHVDTVDDNVDFEFISSKNGDPEDPIEGPFAIRGRNIRYDAENSILIVDLSVENMGENTFDESVTLTFLSLLPEGVTVLNPDNNENGNGAAINFKFENDDGQWTPGEESLLRETHFGVAEGTSIGFVARLDTGVGGGLGSIGGMVWNDENGDGIMDEGEAGVEGAMLELSAEGMEAVTTLSGADGTYSFDDLASGFYMVVKKPTEGMVPTTSPRIYVILVAEDGTVSSFLAANFGCMEDTGGGGKASIGGIVFNDLNGNKVQDEGEPGLNGIAVDLSGDATASVMSDTTGAYVFADLVMGSYEVTSTGPDGFVPTTGPVLMVKIETADQVVDDAHLGWMEDGTGGGSAVIKGLVWNDLNGDGKKTEDEPGIEGLTVDLAGDATATMLTGDDGVFTFMELMAGSYQVTSTGPEGWKATTGTTLEVILATDDEVFNSAAFGWMEDGTGGDKASIGGFVFNDLNGNKVMDEGEPGIEGVQVDLSGDATATAMSDTSGAYSFTDLAIGSYVATCSAVDGFVSTTGTELAVKIETEDQVVDNAHFGWMEDGGGGGKASIGGIVFNDLNGNKVQDEGEPGLEGLKVALDGTSSLLTTSDVDGAYLFADLGMGEYKVRSTGPEGWITTTGDELTIKIETVDQVVDNAHFGWMTEDVGGNAAIGGIVFNDLNGNKVMDEGEPGLEGLTVALSGDATATVTTDATGAYEFTGLNAGGFEVTSTGPDGFISTTGPVLTVMLPLENSIVDNVNFGWMEEGGLLQ